MAVDSKATKEAVSKKVTETDQQAHEQIKKLKESKVGKMLPTSFDKISTKHVAMVSMFTMYVMCGFVYTICVVATATKEGEVNPFFQSWSNYILLFWFAVSLVHDLVVYFTHNSSMLLSFILLRIIVVLSVGFSLLALETHSAAVWFKLVLIVLFAIFSTMYSYVFGVFMSDLKSGDADPSEHQAV
ncbi:hypothetical protein NEDG_00900 [Nematocida displodere]|uniref:Uncharacterized protein n=1 Tax=Nematocida displodere TaxID=1805483 RepID=A0A177ECV6_9MICR|nr:hypothetical protein NEDG_00900 [Nematocida displodere]